MRHTIQAEQLAVPLAETARKAGEAILKVYAETTLVFLKKDDDSPLTAADLAAHHCIVENLTMLTPALPVVSEEDKDSLAHHQPTGAFWLIDPLDGTKEFLARTGEFTVNIALIQDGEPVIGVVYAPVVDKLYWGGRDLGAWRIQSGMTEKICVSDAAKAAIRRRAVASKSHMNAETRDFLTRFKPIELVQAGSSLKFCRIAEGAADIYPRLAPTCEWDTAAAQAVLEGAGGVVVDLDGQRLHYGKTDVLNPSFIAAASLTLIPA